MVGHKRAAVVLSQPLAALVFSGPIRFHCRARPARLILEKPMRLSRYFLPILRETPKEAEIVSHRLMLRAGMMRQEAAGIYAFLPLGLRVLQKIEQIVREEQNRSGAIELLMPTIQSADLWRESGRYDDYGKEMLRIQDRHERDMLYGPTNEEMITEIFRAYVRSYKDLPLNLYHIQWKFRDEVRPRFGLMRGREFLMKDAYSFDLDQAGARHSYNKMFVAYLRTFARLGLKSIPMVAETGPIGGNLSPRVHHPRLDRRERGVLPPRLSRFRRCPARTSNFDDVAGLQAIVDKWTSLYAATSEKHDAGGLRQAAGRQAGVRARHRGRPHLLFRHQIFRADEGRGRRARTAPSSRCTWAPTASGRAGWWPPSSRRSTTTPASNGRRRWRRSRSRSSTSSRATARPTPPARASIATLPAKGVDVLYRRPRRAAGRQIRHRRPDRRSLAGPGRARRGSPRARSRSRRRADGSRELMSPADAVDRAAGAMKLCASGACGSRRQHGVKPPESGEIGGGEGD